MSGNKSEHSWISLTRELLVRVPLDVCSRPAASCDASHVIYCQHSSVPYDSSSIRYLSALFNYPWFQFHLIFVNTFQFPVIPVPFDICRHCSVPRDSSSIWYLSALFSSPWFQFNLIFVGTVQFPVILVPFDICRHTSIPVIPVPFDIC
jgi:hypothetical protein